MPSPVADLLGDLSAALGAAGVRWYLFGAQAAILYGAARLTADVDVTIRLPERLTATALTAGLESHGFSPRFSDPAFVAATRVMPLVHARTGLPVDLVLAGPGIEEQFLDRARTIDVEGVVVPVASPEDLIVMKLLAGRAKDDEDTRAIIRAQGQRLDVDLVRETLGLLQAALAQDDLMPAFERDLAAARPGNTGRN